MKNLLLCFFLLQIASCNFGAIEPKPEATKFSIQNNSGVQLLNVRWNGTNFGDIGSGEVSEKEITDGSGFVFFNANNGKEYRTQTLIMGEKYKLNKFSFVDQTLILEPGNSNPTSFPLSDLNAN